MAWCEANGVDFLLGLAKTDRLVAKIATELDLAAAKSRAISGLVLNDLLQLRRRFGCK